MPVKKAKTTTKSRSVASKKASTSTKAKTKKVASKAKPAAKKKAAVKTTSRTSTKKKTVAKKKTAASKTAVKKASQKTTAPKKSTSKKTTTQKPATKKVNTKKITDKKPVLKKAVAKKAAAKKPVLEKTEKTKPVRKAAAKQKLAIAETFQEGLSAIGVSPYQKAADSDYMDSQMLEHFRHILLAYKAQLMEKVDSTVHYMQDDSANLPDLNDRATLEEEFGLELRTRDRERKLIKKIDEALELIDEGEYGYCEACGVEIGVRRLEARPTATLCIDCKTIQELKEAQRA